MRSADASGPDRRDLRTNTKTLSSSLRPMVSGGGCGCCKWHCCQIAAWLLACLMWKESASFIGRRISGINYGLCDSWLTGPCWQCLTVSMHTVFYKWRVLHLRKITFSLWFQQTLVLLKNIPARLPAKEVESHPVQAWNPSHNFWRWSLSVSEWFTVVWIGTCYLFIQIFRHCILSQCTQQHLCLVNYSETTTMLDAWLFTGGTP